MCFPQPLSLLSGKTEERQMTDRHQPGCRASFWPQSREVWAQRPQHGGLRAETTGRLHQGLWPRSCSYKAFKKCASTYLLLESEDFQAADCPSLCRWLAALRTLMRLWLVTFEMDVWEPAIWKVLWCGFQCQLTMKEGWMVSVESPGELR